MLCLAGTTMSMVSTTVLTTSTKTALTSCLQQVSLMRDTYQSIFAKYKITVPANSKISAANTTAATVTSISNTDGVAINLEQSTATLMTRLSQTTDNRDVANVIALIKTTSLSSHTTAFAAEQTSISAPAPTRAPTPTTPVVPAPSTRPFPAPVTTRTVTVPASIDATGASDVSTALMGFIHSVPDGSLINFPAAGIYRIDHAIEFTSRHNLILDGNGCTLKYTSVTGTTEGYSLLHDSTAGSDIWIRNFVLIGSSPYPGVFTDGTSPTGGQGQHGVAVRSSRTEVSGCTISAVWGDGFYVTGNPSDVWIHDNHVISAGRQGVSVISGRNVLIEHNAFDKCGYHTFDIEPNNASESSANIIFRNNTVGTHGKYFFAVVGNPTSSTIDGIVVNGNTVTGSSLSAYVDNRDGARITHITFTNNAGGKATAGPVLQFSHVDGLTVTGNVQPLSSGVLTRITNSTGR